MKKPNFYFEEKFWRKGYQVIGIDEVGRGALAGPLILAGVCFSKKAKSKLKDIGINDSKKLTLFKREKLALVIKKESNFFHISKISVRYINKYGIVKAFQKGVREIIKKIKIFVNNHPKQKNKIFVLIDGFYVKYLHGIGLKNQKAIINGDEKSISIAAASIIAKVYRDNLMKKLSKKYKQYHFEKNKGYGTKEHIEALKKYGKTKIHRDLYLRRIFLFRKSS